MNATQQGLGSLQQTPLEDILARGAQGIATFFQCLRAAVVLADRAEQGHRITIEDVRRASEL
jgi:hypothetical protein